VMDGDLQDPPEVIPEMVRAWRKGAEVVYGVRTARKEGWFTRATAAAFYRIQARLTRTRMPLDTGDFAAMDRRVVDLIVSISERHAYVRGLRSWVGFRQVAFPYERDRRHRGRPKYTVWKLLDLAVSGIVPFSVVPLRLVALSGAAISALALAAGLGVLLGWMPFVAGVVAALAFLFGLQLLIIGLLGECVGRVVERRRELTPAAFLRYYAEGHARRMVLALHAYEVFLALAALAWWLGSVWVAGYLVGGAMHLALDIGFNGRLTPRNIFAFYSF